MARTTCAALYTMMLLVHAVSAAQSFEPTPPPSQRVAIDLAAGMPGQSSWLYLKDQDSSSATAPTFAQPGFNDTSWTQVGLPYSANFLTTFVNATSGGGNLDGTQNWYRLHFKLDHKYAGNKILVEFEGAHTGAQVFINGTLLPGVSAVAADAQASHVVGFVPFLVDLTPYVKADGTTDNVLAVRVNRSATWFEDPQFSEVFRFGQADAGLFRGVRMFITSQVHIPQNIYSNLKTWGTYVATLSEVPNPNDTATANSAVVEVQTNVLNESTTAQAVTLTTQIVDAKGNVVAAASPVTQTVPAMTPATFPSGPTPMFDQKITVNHPTLWYPNNTTFGKPYLYKAYSIVSVGGQVVDAVQTSLGIRTITWDTSFPSFNGHPMYLWGGSGRYDYPALGSSVPEEQQWRDLAQMAAAGGNIWRPGHSSTSEEFVDAADQYGIMIDQPSGDNEEAFAQPSADQVTLKEELHRDMIIRDRSHPSILDWESNNGTMEEIVGKALLGIVNQWDPINTRVSADRTPDPVNGFILGCTLEGCEVNPKQSGPLADNPWLGMEYWGNGTARGLAYNYELAFVGPFLHNWSNSKRVKAFGMNQWYFADSPGENGLYAEYQQYLNTAQQTQYSNSVRSLGASMVDMSRFPKLLYYVYQAAWTPYAIKPVVKLAGHWNRGSETQPIQENAFSNCPNVRLLVNGVQQGTNQTPKPDTSDPGSNPSQSTTLIPSEVSWTLPWVSGTVTAECLDDVGNVQATDSITTAGAEDHINLSVVPDVVRPDGTNFAVTANGSDAAFVTAQVVDKNNVVVPTAADKITFAVAGPATYMGGSEQYVQSGSDAYSTAAGNTALNYHSPGDPELQVEGGLTRIALRSQFTTGTVTVNATAPGLKAGATAYVIQPIANVTAVTPAAPEIVVPPQPVAVTAGQPASFTVLTTGAAPLSFQWYANGTPIANATAGSYTIAAAVASQNNSGYTVKVSNGMGSATSAPAAILTVDTPAAPVITTQPQPVTAFVGQSATFTVAATGSPTLTYQWELNNVPIAGATAASYTLPSLTAGNSGGKYSVLVSNPVQKNIASNQVLLTVQAAVAPTIVTQPQSQSVLVNNAVTFSVVAGGTPPFTYQWQKGSAPISGATASTFTLPAVQSTDAGSYSVLVTNAAGTVTGGPALLTLAPPGIDLALNQPSAASSYQDPVGLASSLAFDGNLNTRWGSTFGCGTPPCTFSPDPSWLEVDLGSPQPLNTAVLDWDSAYASKYQIQYSLDNNTWNTAVLNSNGAGGIESLSFPTVQGRYVRMYGQARGSQYGYSVNEMSLYNVASCTTPSSDPNERYTVLGPNAVLDNLSHLTWQRSEETYAASTGQQYTQAVAQNYCASQNQRLPSAAEALGISGVAAAACAFPQPWMTWTSTPDPGNSSDAQFVSSGATPGQIPNYQVADNYPGGVLCVSGTSAPAPSITTQPLSATISAGSTALFSVVATGTGPLTYQWYANGAPITGATAASYAAPGTFATGTSFFVVVTGPTAEYVVSTPVTLTVTGSSSGAPIILRQPTPQIVAPGASATFDVYATGSGQLTYQWYLNGVAIQGTAGTTTAPATHPGVSAIYITPPTTTGNNNQSYYVVVKNSAGVATQSNTVTLSVSGAGSGGPVITTEPQPTTVAVGATATFSVVASGGAGALSYQWYLGGAAITNATAASYTTPAVTASSNGEQFYLVVKDASGRTATSNTVALTVTGATSGITLALDTGSAVAVQGFAADTTCPKTQQYDPGQTIIIPSGVAAIAAPEKVYESACQGPITYTITGLTAGKTYTVVLHFAELYFNTAGSREFNVSVNGAAVSSLKNFDIFKAAGNARYTAVVETVPDVATTNGQIVISLTNGAVDQPMLNGIALK